MAGKEPGLDILILSDRPRSDGLLGAERERFGRFVAELEGAGLSAEHRFTPDAGRLDELLDGLSPALVFSASLETADGPRDSARVHALLESRGQAYVGSDPATLELAIDKAALKRRWTAVGIRTPEFLLAHPDDLPGKDRYARLGYPCIVKPNREGNSRGIGEDSVVRDYGALSAKVGETAVAYGPVLVERFLGDDPGLREFTAAMIGSGTRMLVMPAEIRLLEPKAVRVVTTGDKDGHRTAAVPVEDPALRARVADFAAACFRAAGVRDYSRCDMLLSAGELHAIEINGQPMVPDRWFETCSSGAGLGGGAYLPALVLAALLRLQNGDGGPAPRLDAMRDAILRALRDSVPAATWATLSGEGRTS